MARVTVELKNDIEITGTLSSVDDHLNICLDDIEIADQEKYPQFLATQNCFIRGNIIRYIHFNKADVDYTTLEEACRQNSSE